MSTTDADPSALERHIANLIAEEMVDNGAHDEQSITDALLADPTLKAIVDFAADSVEQRWYSTHLSPEVRALLADWRTR